MYFLSADERKLLLRKLLPEARSSGVAEELRGWYWDKPPLSAIYEGRLSVTEVTSQLCASGHDLYLRRVLGLKRKQPSRNGAYTGALQGIVHEVIVEAKRIILEQGTGCLPALANLNRSNNVKPILQNIAVEGKDRLRNAAHGHGAVLESSLHVCSSSDHMGNGSIPNGLSCGGEATSTVATRIAPARLKEEAGTLGLVGVSKVGVGIVNSEVDRTLKGATVTGDWQTSSSAQLVREHITRTVVSVVEEVLTREPRIGSDALLAAALPVIVGYQLDGSLLGLTKYLTVDMLTIGEHVPMLVKFGPRREFHKLAVTGYAMVAESLWECPVNIGCVAYVTIRRGRVTVERDLHIIGDESRQQFIEARDERTRLVEEEIDPGVCAGCHEGCRFNG